MKKVLSIGAIRDLTYKFNHFAQDEADKRKLLNDSVSEIAEKNSEGEKA